VFPVRVVHRALLRLHRALAQVKPESAGQFYGLAAAQIRRELIDLARHHYGAEGQGAHHHTDGGIAAEAKPDEQHEPETLESWTRFHEHVENLPDEQRNVVGLLWYGGLSQPAAAEVLGVSLPTVKRRWQAARMALYQVLTDYEFD
jgi:RNA polymerase sigma-70 factor (ECF subfamily)